jgi:hypothetical protein
VEIQKDAGKVTVYVLVYVTQLYSSATAMHLKILTKPRLDGLALAFADAQPGQSHFQAVLLARLGPA